MERLMRFPEAVPRAPEVDIWLAARPAPLGPLARAWFARLRACGPEVRELLHDGHPTACLGDAAFAEVNVFTHHVNVGFFQGASLPDPHGLLEGSGRFMRHVKLRPGALPPPQALEALITAAYRDMAARVARP